MTPKTILSYAPLVKKIAVNVRRRTSVRVDLDDLISAGNLGLLEAFESYDPSGNVPFGAYAAKRIRWRILDEIRQFAPVPSHQLRKFKRVQTAKKTLTQENARDPTVEEIAAVSGLSERVVKRYLILPRFVLASEDIVADTSPHETLFELLEPHLSEEEKDVLLALANGFSVPKTAQRCGIQRQNVIAAMEKIKKIILEIQN